MVKSNKSLVSDKGKIQFMSKGKVCNISSFTNTWVYQSYTMAASICWKQISKSDIFYRVCYFFLLEDACLFLLYIYVCMHPVATYFVFSQENIKYLACYLLISENVRWMVQTQQRLGKWISQKEYIATVLRRNETGK